MGFAFGFLWRLSCRLPSWLCGGLLPCGGRPWSLGRAFWRRFGAGCSVSGWTPAPRLLVSALLARIARACSPPLAEDEQLGFDSRTAGLNCPTCSWTAEFIASCSRSLRSSRPSWRSSKIQLAITSSPLLEGSPLELAWSCCSSFSFNQHTGFHSVGAPCFASPCCCPRCSSFSASESKFSWACSRLSSVLHAFRVIECLIGFRGPRLTYCLEILKRRES